MLFSEGGGPIQSSQQKPWSRALQCCSLGLNCPHLRMSKRFLFCPVGARSKIGTCQGLWGECSMTDFKEVRKWGCGPWAEPAVGTNGEVRPSPPLPAVPLELVASSPSAWGLIFPVPPAAKAGKMIASCASVSPPTGFAESLVQTGRRSGIFQSCLILGVGGKEVR